MDGTHHVYGVATQSGVPTPDCAAPREVPLLVLLYFHLRLLKLVSL